MKNSKLRKTPASFYWLCLAWVGGSFLCAAGVVAVGVSTMASDDTPSLTWNGWREAVMRYRRTRAPDEQYSIESHREAAWSFRQAIKDEEHFRSVHWEAVRLVAETMMLTWMYRESTADTNRGYLETPNHVGFGAGQPD